MMDSSLNPQGLRGWAEWAYCQGKVEGVAVAGYKPLPRRAYPLYTVMLKNGELLGHASPSTPLAKRTDPSQSGGKREWSVGCPLSWWLKKARAPLLGGPFLWVKR